MKVFAHSIANFKKIIGLNLYPEIKSKPNHNLTISLANQIRENNPLFKDLDLDLIWFDYPNY